MTHTKYIFKILYAFSLFSFFFFFFETRKVLTKYIHKLGVSNDWSLTDVVGLEPEMLEWIPKPVKSIILLFPCSDKVFRGYFLIFAIFYKIYLCSMKNIVLRNMNVYRLRPRNILRACFICAN